MFKKTVKTNFVIAVACTLLAACNTTPQQNTVTLKDIEQMTQEQVEALSPEQVNAVMEEADHSLLNLQVTDVEKLQSLAQWPNYTYTLAVSTGVNYETYLSGYYKKYSGPDWSDDGCSVPFKSKIPTLSWLWNDNACRHHDFGYSNLPQYVRGDVEAIRALVDTRFLLDMNLKCVNYYPWWNLPMRNFCAAQALVFYGAVRAAGWAFYYNLHPRYF